MDQDAGISVTLPQKQLLGAVSTEQKHDLFGNELNVRKRSFPALKNDLLLRAIRHEYVERPPMWAMRQAGRYLPEYNQTKGSLDFFETCRDPLIATELTLQPIERFSGLIDAAIIFSDILVIPIALGMNASMDPGRGPVFSEPIRTVEQAEKLLQVKPNLQRSLQYVYDAITLTRARLEGRVPLLGFCGAPWTLLAYMIEGSGSKLFTQSKKFLLQNKVLAKRLLKLLADTCTIHLALQIAAGAQAIQVFDSWAGQLAPDEFAEFSLPYLKEIVQQLPVLCKKLGVENVPAILFTKNAWFALDSLFDSGFDVLSLDWSIRPAFALRVRGDRKVALQAGIDPAILLADENTIRTKAQSLMTSFDGGHEGVIINLGHGIVPETNPEHLRWYFTACKEAAEEEKVNT